MYTYSRALFHREKEITYLIVERQAGRGKSRRLGERRRAGSGKEEEHKRCTAPNCILAFLELTRALEATSRVAPGHRRGFNHLGPPLANRATEARLSLNSINQLDLWGPRARASAPTAMGSTQMQLECSTVSQVVNNKFRQIR